ncbi:MAG TPA: lysophospholipid acyltransferase family protein [Chitinispirillaceae bacterium]|nr:lysophospholipid acyltransferase family protein [Chitinispirillaceae bacterium]
MIGAVIKFFLFALLLLLYVLTSLIILVLIRSEEKRLRLLSRITSLGSRLGIFILGIKIKKNNYPPENTSPCLIVANHLSYLDILILASSVPSLFITSVEVQKMFFLGFMSTMAGSLFVERRSKTRLKEEIERLSELLEKGFTITLFPEGTSSNGDSVLPFKGALFSAAGKKGIDIQPVCIKYHSIDGRPVSPDNRDLAFYYGDIVFLPHLLRLFLVKRIDVSVTWLDRVRTDQGSRKDIVDYCHRSISSVYAGN